MIIIMNLNNWTWTCIFSLWVVNLFNTIQANNPEVAFNDYVQPYDTYYENCATPVTCDINSKYRTSNGSCNNLENHLWGSSGTPYIRLTPANYADGDHTIRLQSDDSMLPGPRDLQLALFLNKAQDANDSRNFHINEVGQWLAHDITLMSPDLSGPADCCAVQNTNNIPPQCQTVINVQDDDPVYSTIHKTCLPFRRAMTSTLNFNCNLTPQIQINQASAFIDISQVYGSTDTKASSLRTHVHGKLKVDIINEQQFSVQKQRNNSLFCDGRNDVSVCFDGGDPRNNQHFGLILYQEMFTRFHNHIAELLIGINPYWTDEILYLEARRIMGAINQIIIYRDYIPVLLGKTYAEEYGLTLSKDKKTIYDPFLMPQLAVEFSGGCFRIPHNNIPSTYYFIDKNDKIVDKANLNEFMSFPDPVVKNFNFEEILRGMSDMPSRCPVASYNYLISNFMFHKWIPGAADVDLLSIDIQRGRDIGLSAYTKVREICGFSSISSFDDLSDVLLDEDIEILKTLYASVHDVDLLVGALLEPLASDAMVGPTARCIIADGLHRLRYGDRYFCDVENQPGSFTREQFNILWELDFTKIFCAMSRINKLPKDIFMPFGFSERYDCSVPLDLNLQAWSDNSLNQI